MSMGMKSSAQASASTASSNFFGTSVASSYGAISDGYIRLPNVLRATADLRQRWLPIRTFGNPADYVPPPKNAGDSDVDQAQVKGMGTFGTSQ